MKTNVLSFFLFASPLFAFLQQYQLPASYTFDYQVVQHYKNSDKNGNSDKTVDYYYGKNGDYVAFKSADKNSMVIFTKDGVTIAIDNDKKSIVIFRMSNMLSGFANNAAGAKTNPSANAHHDSAANYQSLKTGNTKQICGYPAEEYVVTDNKGEKAHVWYVKVDFNAQLFYTMAASGMKGLGNSDNSPQNPFQKSMSNPNLLVGEVDAEKHPEHTLTTESITKKEMVIATSGYNVRNMSNMSLQDMMQQKGK